MWELLDKSQQTLFITNRCGIEGDSITYEMIHECEYTLNRTQRDTYIDYVSARVADTAYREVDPDHESAANVYYFHLLRVPLETRAKMLWHVLNGVQP